MDHEIERFQNKLSWGTAKPTPCRVTDSTDPERHARPHHQIGPQTYRFHQITANSYKPSVAKGNPAGSLGSASLDRDGTTYHVRRLLDSGYGNLVGIEFTADIPSDTTGIVLRVGDLDLPFDEAPIRTDTFSQWTLDNTWTVGSVLKVELLRP